MPQRSSPPRPNALLRRAREARGWSQEQLAEQLGTNAFTISRWERGHAVPRPHFRQQLVTLFAQSPEALGLLPNTQPQQAGAPFLLAQPFPASSDLSPSAMEPAFLQHLSLPAGRHSAPEGRSTEGISGPAICLLPPRPRHFLGRKEALQRLLDMLEQGSPGQMYAIVGMPGIGKSALAAEAIHHLSNAPSWVARFPDGILSLSGRGHQGEVGLMALLAELLVLCSDVPTETLSGSTQEISQWARVTLAGRRMLLLLDDLDPTFPLAKARPLLLAQRENQEQRRAGCTVLITSRAVLSPGLVEGWVTLDSLDPAAASELLLHLVGSPWPSDEQAAAQQLCELVGYVPGAIEWIAHALALGLSASWLASHFSQFTQTRAGEGGLYARMAQAVAALPTDLQGRLARLAPLGTRPFRVEEATLLHLPEAIWTAETCEAAPGPFPNPPVALSRETGTQEDANPRYLAAPILAATAADLLQLAEQSLLVPERPASNRFRMPPLLQAVAADLEHQQYAEALALAQAHSRSLPEARWQQIFSALAHAWSSDNHAHVVELAYSLHRMATRLPVRLGEQVLRWGIAASQALHDSYYLVRFLTRLGKLLLYRGDFITTQALWQEATSLTQAMFRQATSDRVLQLLIPWSNLTLIPGVQDEHEEAERRVQRLLRQSEDVGAEEDIAAAYNKLAFYRRLQGKADQAARASETAHTLARGQDWSPGMLAEIALEQARLAGAYEQTTQVLKTLLTTPLDPQAEADLVYDQALYALNQGHRDEAYAYAQQSLKLAQHARTPVIARRGQELLGRLASA